MPNSAEPASYSEYYSISPLEKIEHALIGVSPFNSYFTESNLEKLFRWAISNFKNINIFIPDEISAYTFQAMGYSEKRAKKKTRRQDCYLRNKVIKALIANKISESEARNKIIYLSHLIYKAEYLEVYNSCLKLFETDEFFRNGCLATSKWVLSNKGIPNSSEDLINMAVKYFLAELPMFLDTPKILNVSSSFFVYKDIPNFLEIIYNKKLLVSPKQGFLTIRH